MIAFLGILKVAAPLIAGVVAWLHGYQAGKAIRGIEQVSNDEKKADETGDTTALDDP